MVTEAGCMLIDLSNFSYLKVSYHLSENFKNALSFLLPTVGTVKARSLHTAKKPAGFHIMVSQFIQFFYLMVIYGAVVGKIECNFMPESFKCAAKNVAKNWTRFLW